MGSGKARGLVHALLLLTLVSSTASSTHGAQDPQIFPFRVGVIADEAADDGLSHVSDLLRHLGYPYDVITEGDQYFAPDKYSLLIVSQSGLRSLGEAASSTILTLARGRSFLWIGPGADLFTQEVLTEIFGIRVISEVPATSLGIASASSGSRTTRIFDEPITRIELAGASAKGHFIDAESRNISPSECHLERGPGTSTYFFAYDVAEWWNVDLESPWSRPAILASAIRTTLSAKPSVILRPYPRNLNSAFICRVEDVDPLHTGMEWLTRAHRYLEEYATRKIPLSVALIPSYVDPNGSRINLSEESAKPLRDWLNLVTRTGGSLAQHGYTHQHSSQRTGVGTEFLVDGMWMPYEEQKRRIMLGKTEIENTLCTKVLTFEAPHYKFNEDTLRALEALGFKHMFDDQSSPVFGFWSSGRSKAEPSLVLLHETLGYVPLDSDMQLENRLKATVDQLLEFGGMLLFYNHLFDETAFTIGLRITDYIQQKGHIWTANIDKMGKFATERAKSYAKFAVSIGSNISVQLGPCSEKGLTLSFNVKEKIRSVQINGKEWPVFNADYVVLPELLEDSNTVTISFEIPSRQIYPLPWGLIILGFVAYGAFFSTRKVLGDGS